MSRQVRLGIILFALALFGLPAHSGAAQDQARCFAETGFCISGRIREFWERNGGLPVFGLPITEQREEINRETTSSYQTQWFERVRMELHPENQPPYDVLLGRIGDDRLRQTGRDWQAFPREAPQSGCEFFAQTGFNVCGEILRVWHANGLELDGRRGISANESLALYGAPLSPPMTEIIEGQAYTAQWFERARFEQHPENQPPYNLLLGRLAAEVRDVALGAPGPRALLISSDSQLYSINADGTGQTRLPFTDQLVARTQVKAKVGEVSVAPDGQQIAAIVRFESAPGGAETSSLVVTSRDGRGVTRMLAQSQPERALAAPAWSPDGRQIAFVDYIAADDRYHIVAVNADGRGRRQVTSGKTNDTAPQWSPDGTTLAFLSDPNATYPALGGQYLLAVAPAQGGLPRGVASFGGYTFQWVPGGNELVFTTASNERRQIVALNPATMEQRTIVSEDGDLSDSALSPDGSQIAYYRCCSSYNSQLVVRDFRSGRVVEVGYARETPRWSPDGQFIAVIEDQRVRYPSVVYRVADGARVGMASGIVGWLP